MNEKLNTFPYFYIIEHIRTKKLYCGSQYSKKCNPKNLLSTEKNTYTTSSKIINEIIDIEGIDIFIIRKIKIFNTGDKAYNYETRFLQKLDCANNPKFYNKHNNNGSNSAVHFTNKNLKCYRKDNKISYFREGCQPEGWVLGQTNSFKENRSKATSGKNNPRYGERGRKFYNNGVSCKLFISGTEIEGFKLGLLRGGNAQIK